MAEITESTNVKGCPHTFVYIVYYGPSQAISHGVNNAIGVNRDVCIIQLVVCIQLAMSLSVKECGFYRINSQVLVGFQFHDNGPTHTHLYFLSRIGERVPTRPLDPSHVRERFKYLL